MPRGDGIQRILLKSAGGTNGAPLRLAAGSIDFDVEPLFTSIGVMRAPGLAEAPQWHLLTPKTSVDGIHPWDVCHQVIDQALALQGAAGAQFAEPDLEQQWATGRPAEVALAVSAACDDVAKPDVQFPQGDGPTWFQDPQHAQFMDALAALGAPTGAPVRVVHLDTGYDPAHATLPVNLNRALQHNFVETDQPTDATDRSPTGALQSLGHGTGTLGILAGKAVGSNPAIGAVPWAEVIPVRVANSVVLFYTSAIARAFDYAHQLHTTGTPVDVITMSMGGLASAAWAEAVNALYEAGIFIVTAAGNNYGNLPTRNIVFPARFNRVVAACGVMADHSAYADLGFNRMAGNYGPAAKMRTALGGFTPNTPWARIGCAETIDLNGAGTSSATPQVAAAAALWIQRNRDALNALPAPWMRVEAVRKALFDSANHVDQVRLGWGELRANAALQTPPANAADFHAEDPDTAAFPFLRLLLGTGLAEPDAHQRMLELEALQLSQSAEIEQLLTGLDPAEGNVDPAKVATIRDALAAHPRASQALRSALQVTKQASVFPSVPAVQMPTVVADVHLQHASKPKPPAPTRRRLRVYAYDPSLGSRLETLGINETVLEVPWEEELSPGPIGKYVEVIDIDPASDCCYAPVDLNDPHLLVRDGLAPSETTPQFHQQMVYAVTMNTIEHFERALGRVALWAPRTIRPPGGGQRLAYTQRLRIYPHALRTRNAFYSPERKALMLGYFVTSISDSSEVLPGGLVFSALSSDIVAHESTHALLDGLHRRFLEPTNPDVLAFHEAFADIVALFQHFSMPGALRQAIQTTRGDLRMENLLSQLAVQFGQATGKYGALRDAIGSVDPTTGWHPAKPSTSDYSNWTDPHARGSILVAAVFDAFLQIYRRRSADLIRLASQGTGILPAGEIPIDLRDRLAREASAAATNVLQICVRALDYCPPVDITFGEYLRALITADRDLIQEDPGAYRVAFVSAFQARGIYPAGARTLSVDNLVWEPPPIQLTHIDAILRQLNLDWDLMSDRKKAYDASRSNAARMHAWLLDLDQVSDPELDSLGLIRNPEPIPRTIGGIDGELRPIEVHSVRPARRVGPDGQQRSDVVVEITQSFRPSERDQSIFRGGCTLLIDLSLKQVRYLVRKRIDHAGRFAAQQAFAFESAASLRANYYGDGGAGRAFEPFALLHSDY